MFLVVVLAFSIFHSSRGALTSKGSLDQPLSSQCVVTDSLGDIRIAGGLGGASYNYLGTSYKMRVNRAGNAQKLTSRSAIRLKTIFAGWFMPVTGFACEGGNSGAYYNNMAYYIGVNDHTNIPKCWACNDQNVCDDLTSSGQCTGFFGTCVVQDGSYAYIIGGSRNVEFTDQITCLNLATQQKEACPTNYGRLNLGVHNAGCAKVGSNLLVVGGHSYSNNYANIYQICRPGNTKCTIVNGQLPTPSLGPAVYADLNGNPNCDAIVMGGESSAGSTNSRLRINTCSTSITVLPSLPVSIGSFGSFVANGLICLIGGLDSSWQSYSSIICENFGNTPQPTQQQTQKPTDRPSLRPSNPPSRRPTSRPTQKPTGNPTTSQPSKSPTVKPTHADISRPDWSRPWNIRHQLAHGISAAACGVDPQSGDLMLAGGRKYSATGQALQHNEALTWKKGSDLSSYSSILTKRTFPQWGPSFSQVLEGMFVEHSGTVRYKSKTYVCAPQYWNPRNNAELLKCTVENGDLQCYDVCSVMECPLLTFSPCCVAIGDYLYWIGGNYGPQTYDTIKRYNMKKEQWDSSSDYGPLARPTDSATCAAWNSRIYVFGGNSATTMRGTPTIQNCAPGGTACRMSGTTLPSNQIFGNAVTIGSSIVIGCGSGANYQASIPAAYDAYTDKLDTNFKPGEALNGRTECCITVFNGNLTVIGGFQDDTVATNPTPRKNRLEECHNLVLSGTGSSSFDGSYTQVRIPSLISSYPVWKSRRNWIYYSDASKKFWIWSASAYAFNSKLLSGVWVSYQAQGKRTEVNLLFSCNDKVATVQPVPNDPCATMSWDCPAMRAVVITVCTLFGLGVLFCVVWTYCQRTVVEQMKMRQAAVNRVTSRSEMASRPGTLTVNNVFPDAPEGFEMPTQRIVGEEDNSGEESRDSAYLDNEAGVVFDVDERPGDADESTYYYHQSHFTQDVLFPDPKSQ